jgi:hypothetical protein
MLKSKCLRQYEMVGWLGEWKAKHSNLDLRKFLGAHDEYQKSH